MIPLPIAPLTGVTILVTRPAGQTESLCARIDQSGGHPIAFPTIAIEPVSIAPELGAQTPEYDWLIFVSVNAVEHGRRRVTVGERTRTAAIGKATAAALESKKIRVDVCPKNGATSEALLDHPDLKQIANQSVLIVKGEGGRELLHDALLQRGARVTTLDVYRRILPVIEAVAVQQLEHRWREDPVDIVTLTSVQTLDNLLALLTSDGRALLGSTAFVTVSERIAAAARAHGLQGFAVLSRGADDESIIGAIAAWHARAR